MTYNELLLELKAIAKLDKTTIVKVFELAGYTIDTSELKGLFRQEDQEGFIECQSNILSLFLDGLIIYKRGKRENSPAPDQHVKYLSNNDILKKIRIAFELREEDLLATMALADFRISKSEITALFRKKGHKNYQECGNQFLRNFIRGLKRYRK